MQFFIAIFVSYLLRIVLSFYDGYSGHAWLGKWFQRHWPRWLVRDLNVLLLLVFVAEIGFYWLLFNALLHWLLHSYFYTVGWFYQGGNLFGSLLPKQVSVLSVWRASSLMFGLSYKIYKQSRYTFLAYNFEIFYYSFEITLRFEHAARGII